MVHQARTHLKRLKKHRDVINNHEVNVEHVQGAEDLIDYIILCVPGVCGEAILSPLMDLNRCNLSRLPPCKQQSEVVSAYDWAGHDKRDLLMRFRRRSALTCCSAALTYLLVKPKPVSVGASLFLPRCCLALFLLLHPGSVMLGNDGAAEVALGGIRLKQERRVAMVKERLYISKKKVRVEYEFRNESQETVTTEIAFPIPEYHLDLGYGWSPFEDFKVWVDGKPLPHRTEARAFLKGREITAELEAMKLDVASFARFEEPKDSRLPFRSQIRSLSPNQKQRLVSLGAISAEDEVEALWSVKKTYHWTQTFPGQGVVKIVHEYTPVYGYSASLTLPTLKAPTKDWHNETADPACPDNAFIQAFNRAVAANHKRYPTGTYANQESLPAAWVRYILTTANTWKTPITDFELVVDRDPGELLTFCWDGPVEKTGANTFRARKTDFVPSKELTVYFLQP